MEVDGAGWKIKCAGWRWMEVGRAEWSWVELGAQFSNTRRILKLDFTLILSIVQVASKLETLEKCLPISPYQQKCAPALQKRFHKVLF